MVQMQYKLSDDHWQLTFLQKGQLNFSHVYIKFILKQTFFDYFGLKTRFNKNENTHTHTLKK